MWGSSFRWFFAGRIVSLAGNAMTPVALAFAVLQATNSAAYLSLVLAAQFTPAIALLILGGGFADRYRRDVLLRISNLGAGISQGAVALAVLTGAPTWMLIPLAFVNGVNEAFTTPALRGIIPQLVGEADRQRANSLLSTTHNAVRIMGPTVAGVLVATVGGGWAIALDAASFLIAAACMLRVRVAAHPSARSETFLRDLRDGWSYFRALPWIWSITAAFAVINAIQQGVWQVLGPVIAKDTFGAPGWGLVLSARAIGLLVFSAVMLRWGVRRRPMIVGLPAVALGAIPLVLLGLHVGVPGLAAVTFVAGAGTAVFGIIWDTTMQSNVPNQMLSRVSSYDDFGSYAAIPLGQLSVVPIAGLIGVTAVAVLGGGAYALAALLPLSLASVRRLTVATGAPTTGQAGTAQAEAGRDTPAVVDAPG